MLQACIEEDDPDTAFALLFRFHPYADRVEPSVMELFYNKTLLLCTQSEIPTNIKFTSTFLHSALEDEPSPDLYANNSVVHLQVSCKGQMLVL